MIYCKIIRDGNIIDVGTMFLYWVSKNQILAYCNANLAELMQSSLDADRLYHAEWFRVPPANVPEYTEAEIQVINKEEYDELYALLSDGEQVKETVEQNAEPEHADEPVEAHDEKPMTVQQMREKITELEDTIAKILQTIK